MLAVIGAQLVTDVRDALAAQGIAAVIQHHAVKQFGHALHGRQHLLPGVQRGQRCRQGQEEGDGRGLHGADVGHVEAAWLHDAGHREDRAALGVAFHQAVKHVHVAEHQAGLLGRHHDVLTTQLLAGPGSHEQGDDLVEILGGALAEITGARVGFAQTKFGLLAFRAHARFDAAIGHGDAVFAQYRLAALAAGRFRAFHATPLGLLFRTAKQEDRGDQQQAGGQDADAQQCRVGHSIGSPASSFR